MSALSLRLSPEYEARVAQLEPGTRARIDALRIDPLLIRFTERRQDWLERHPHADLRGSLPVRNPLDVIGEQRAFAFVHFALGNEVLATTLLSAVPYLWLNEIDLVASALPIPSHIVSADLLPFPSMWWTFEGAHPVHDQETGREVALSDGMLITQRPNGWFEIDTLGSDISGRSAGNGGTPLVFRSAAIRPGWRWPNDFPANERPIAGRVLAMLSFLASPFVESAIQRPHTTKKGALRGVRLAELQAVRFVRLRPSAVDTIPHAADSGSVQWKNRWIVRGHHRAQWYPSLNAHKLIWIAPHVKGPAEAPMKMPAYLVAR